MVTDLESSFTWQFDVNNFVRDSSSPAVNNRFLLLTIKNILISFPLSPWTVIGSSNSVAAGIDAVDRWVTSSNIVNNTAGNPHSWIVLKQTGLGSNFQLLIDCSSTATDVVTISVSYSVGFSGGSTTAAPTAADSVIIRNATSWGGQATGSGNVFSAIVHGMQSTDGYGTIIAVTRAAGPFGNGTPAANEPSGVCAFWYLAQAKNPLSTWDTPIICTIRADNATSGLTPGSGVTAAASFTQSSGFVSRQNSTAIAGRASCEGTGTSLLIDSLVVPNEIDGKRPFYPIGVYSLTTGYRGRICELYDVWFAPVEYGHLSTYEDINENQRAFIQFENVIIPWDGSYILSY